MWRFSDDVSCLAENCTPFFLEKYVYLFYFMCVCACIETIELPNKCEKMENFPAHVT